MATGEKNFVKRVMDNLKKRGMVFQRHEDLYSVGIPDMSYEHPDCMGSGWIEAKSVKAWPKRASTTIKMKHYTPQQVAWAMKHGLMNQRTWLLLEVDTFVFLIAYNQCRRVQQGLCTRYDLTQISSDYWGGRIDYDELYLHLGGPC